MAITWTDLQAHVGSHDPDEQPFLETCVETATALVNAHIGDAEVPVEVLDSALLEVGSKLYGRKGSTHAYSGGDTVNSPSVLVAKDPMVTAYPLLAKFVVVGL